MIIILNDYYIHFCQGLHLGSRFLQIRVSLELSSTLWSYPLQIVVVLLCSCLCLFDAIVELHDMDELLYIDFLIGKLK